MSEFGWPSHYDHDGIVPPNRQFHDTPDSALRASTPSTPDMQKRAYAETIAWVENFTAINGGLHGALAWSLIDKPSGGEFYRDPFGMYDSDRKPMPEVEWFKRLYTNGFTESNRLWQPITGAEGDAQINGRDGDVAPPATA